MEIFKLLEEKKVSPTEIYNNYIDTIKHEYFDKLTTKALAEYFLNVLIDR
jgi:hypothetical protein